MSRPDWTMPLEAVNTDGRVVPVELADKPQPDIDGDYVLSRPVSGPYDLFRGDGTCYAGGPWTIRNRTDHDDIAPDEALTLRDRFAMAALPGLCDAVVRREIGPSDLSPAEYAARTAYQLADAMLEARK